MPGKQLMSTASTQDKQLVRGDNVYNRNHDVLSAERFRCAVGGEWKPSSGFSNRYLKTLESKTRRGIRVSAANTGMVCREHSGEPVTEKRCEGPCNMVKSLIYFSKNARSNGVLWCQDCVAWQVAQEPIGDAPVECGADDLAFRELSMTGKVPQLENGDGTSTLSYASYGTSTAGFSTQQSGMNSASQTNRSRPPHLGSRARGQATQSLDERDDDSIAPSDSASRVGTRPPHLQRAGTSALSSLGESGGANGNQGYLAVNPWNNAGRLVRQEAKEIIPPDTESNLSFATRELSSVNTAVVPSLTSPRTSEPCPQSQAFSTRGNGKWAKIERRPEPTFVQPNIPADLQYDDDSDIELP